MPNNSVTLDPKQLSSLLKKIESFRDGTDPTILAVVPFCDRATMEKLLFGFTYYALVTSKKEPESPESPDYHFFTSSKNPLNLGRIVREAPKGTEVIIVTGGIYTEILAHKSWLSKPTKEDLILGGFKFRPEWGSGHYADGWRSIGTVDPKPLKSQIAAIRKSQKEFLDNLVKVTVEFP